MDGRRLYKLLLYQRYDQFDQSINIDDCCSNRSFQKKKNKNERKNSTGYRK